MISRATDAGSLGTRLGFFLPYMRRSMYGSSCEATSVVGEGRPVSDAANLSTSRLLLLSGSWWFASAAMAASGIVFGEARGIAGLSRATVSA